MRLELSNIPNTITLFDVSIMTYWSDEARSTTFCLAECRRVIHRNDEGVFKTIMSGILKKNCMCVSALLPEKRLKRRAIDTGLLSIWLRRK
jgi:hypothetical protein